MQLHSRGARMVLAVMVATVLIPARSATAAVGDGDDSATRMYWAQATDADFSAIRLVTSLPDGTGQHALTDPPPGAQDIDPKPSPDGAWVLYERDLPDGSVQVRLVHPVGKRHDHALDLPCTDPCGATLAPTWGPGGDRVWFTRIIGPFDQANGSARSAVLWSTDLDGHGLRRESRPGIDGAFEDYAASFAPAGYLVFVRIRNADIKSAAFRMDPGGRHLRRLTPWSLDADTLSVSPARTGPSRDLVVFETYGHGIPDGKTSAVATVSAAGAPEVRFLTSRSSTPVHNLNPTWSPDGRSIAFSHVRLADGAEGDIWRMRWDGHGQRSVSTSPLFEFRPAWGRAP